MAGAPAGGPLPDWGRENAGPPSTIKTANPKVNSKMDSPEKTAFDKLVDTKTIRDFYTAYVQKHGVSAGWSSMETAINAYGAVSSGAGQRWGEYRSVLDVGSGEGHLFEFLAAQRGFAGHYTGLEVLPFFHEKACELYQRHNQTSFVCAEFLGHDFGAARFDWVLSLGGLSVKQPRQADYDREFCRKMAKLANHGISVYLNDIRQMRPGRLAELPDLNAHDIPAFVAMLNEELEPAAIEVMHYPTPSSQNAIVHATLKSA